MRVNKVSKYLADRTSGSMLTRRVVEIGRSDEIHCKRGKGEIARYYKIQLFKGASRGWEGKCGTLLLTDVVGGEGAAGRRWRDSERHKVGAVSAIL
jgi:hypothetical protein